MDDPVLVERYVQVQDASTLRQYCLLVPPTIQTTAEAVAWNFYLSVEAYAAFHTVMKRYLQSLVFFLTFVLIRGEWELCAYLFP